MTALETYVWKNQNRQTRELMDETGLTAQEIWAAYDAAFDEMNRGRKNAASTPRSNWTQEETEALARMRKDGSTYKQIAVVLGRNVDSVAGKWRVMRVKGHDGF